MKRLRKALTEWSFGRRYNYPVCCISWFCFAQLLGVSNRCKRAGKVRRANNSVYVPCLYHRLRKPAGYERYGERRVCAQNGSFTANRKAEDIASWWATQ